MCAPRPNFFRSYRLGLLLRKEVLLVAGVLGVISLLFSGCELVGLGGGPSGPRLTEIPGKIVYSKEVAADGNLLSQLFVTDQTGTRQLTRDDNPDREIFATDPAWGPDGETIIYATNRGDVPVSKTALYRMDADGSNQRPLMQAPGLERPLWGNHPAVSPDGKKVAYDKCTNCELGGKNTEVFVVDLEAGTVDTLTSYSGHDSNPSWNPTGTKVVFTSDRPPDIVTGSELYTRDLRNGEPRRLTHTDGSIRSNGYWSPTDTHVAFVGDGRDHIVRIPLNSTAERENVAVTFRNHRLVDPLSWGTDSILLARTLNREDTERCIVQVELSDGSAESVLCKSDLGPFDWFIRKG